MQHPVLNMHMVSKEQQFSSVVAVTSYTVGPNIGTELVIWVCTLLQCLVEGSIMKATQFCCRLVMTLIEKCCQGSCARALTHWTW